jgi:hypothetical protein
VSDFIDKAVESVGHIISEGQIQSAIGGLRQRLADADRRRKISLIKQEIRDLQAEEAQSINALSTQVWALYEAGSLTGKRSRKRRPNWLSLSLQLPRCRPRISVPTVALPSSRGRPSVHPVVPGWSKRRNPRRCSFACIVALNCARGPVSAPSAAKR